VSFSMSSQPRSSTSPQKRPPQDSVVERSAKLRKLKEEAASAAAPALADEKKLADMQREVAEKAKELASLKAKIAANAKAKQQVDVKAVEAESAIKAKIAKSRAPPTAFLLWFNQEGRASARARYPERSMKEIASVGGIMWNQMPPQQRLPWHVHAKKLRAAFDVQREGGRGRAVKWAATAGNACRIRVKNEWVVGFIHERDRDRVHVVYEVEGETHGRTLFISDNENLQAWAPTVNGACRVFSNTAKEWRDAVVIAQTGATLTVSYDINGIGYSKQVDAADTGVLRWPLYSEGEQMVNVGRFRALFKEGILSIEDARTFCKRFFIPVHGERPVHTYTWQGACAHTLAETPARARARPHTSLCAAVLLLWE
jgi:hypothetical protein